MTIDPTLLLIASLTFFFGGLSKGAMGFGLPIIAIPMLAFVGSLPLALSIAVFPVVATNLWQVWKYRKHGRLPFLRWFLVIGTVGVLMGVVLLKNVEDAFLKIILGCLVLLYLFVRQTSGIGALSPRLRDRSAPFVGGLAGMVHGATGLSGLVGTPFLHAANLERPSFIFGNSLMFTLFSALQMPLLASFGLYESSAVLIGLITVIPAFAGLWLGNLLGERLQAKTFPIVVQIMLACSAVLPIWNGLSDLVSPS